MPKQMLKKMMGHLGWRVGRALHGWGVAQDQVVASLRVGYHRTALFPKYRLPEISLSSLDINEQSNKPLIMDDICMPPYYSFGESDKTTPHWSSDHDDIGPLLALIAKRSPKIIVELGTAHGNTTANICQQCIGATVYTINAPVEVQTGDTTTFDLTVDEIGDVYRKHGFADRVIQIYKNTLDLDLSEYLDKPLLDIAIIDACHDEEYVINDFLKVEPYVSPGGMILLHDTHPSMKQHLVGSYVGCMKLRARGYDIQHLEGTWWGIWIKESRERG